MRWGRSSTTGPPPIGRGVGAGGGDRRRRARRQSGGGGGVPGRQAAADRVLHRPGDAGVGGQRRSEGRPGPAPRAAGRVTNLLLTPGPTPIPPAVVAAEALPLPHHRSPEFKLVLARVL